MESLAKIYFALGAVLAIAGAAYIIKEDISPEASINLRYYSSIIGWLLGFAAIQFMRRHFHSGELQIEYDNACAKKKVESLQGKTKSSKKRKNQK